MNAAQNLAKYLSALAVMAFCSAIILFLPGPESPLGDATASVNDAKAPAQQLQPNVPVEPSSTGEEAANG